ncbi:hypothetical protein A0J48_009635 [Sphaerospermopsis aphanizomenoides BCCUSP55]|uniref:hypothetical protein n=1 Tax=Sphaerospermopsis aphanizomenoides TaxID=459663 RepID=UPI0019055213|nr:hypothetical protein [Sphaerospermopsis aphanizomenoides]MBK1987795.1 hypothetical protein [Sphaerospermopsis aphanizomenoides BCCUSP55]
MSVTSLLGSFALMALGTSIAHAGTVTATLTADNHYGLYYGQADGSGLTLVGRNEFGSNGNPGEYNWSLPETYNFQANSGDYLYVVAWDDGGPQSWLGQFTLPDNTTLFSNTTDWEYSIGSGQNPGTLGNLPTSTTLVSDITSATWLTPLASVPNTGSNGIWGAIPGISASANFIWTDDFNSTATDNNYVIFRTKAPLVAIPESQPITLVSLVVAGLSVQMVQMVKHKFKAP